MVKRRNIFSNEPQKWRPAGGGGGGGGGGGDPQRRSHFPS